MAAVTRGSSRRPILKAKLQRSTLAKDVTLKPAASAVRIEQSAQAKHATPEKSTLVPLGVSKRRDKIIWEEDWKD